MNVSSVENIVFESPAPEHIYCYTPAIVSLRSGRLVVTIDIGGEGVAKLKGEKSSRAAGNKFGQGKVFISDDNGLHWRHVKDFPFWHARIFQLNSALFVIGHRGDICIMKSEDEGETWSETHQLTSGEKWHASACNVIINTDKVYLAMERRFYTDSIQGWNVAGLSPIVLSASIDTDLCEATSWSQSKPIIFKEIFDIAGGDFFGIPFYPTETDHPVSVAGSRTNAPLGWLEANIVQICDPNHLWFDPQHQTFHLFLRAHTGGTGYACLVKVTKLVPALERSPSGNNLLFVPFPGGHLKFYILHDEKSALYWLLSNQATDSMRKPETLLKVPRFGLPNNERHRLQLHFSKNCIDWCFAGMIVSSNDEHFSRNYPAGAIQGNDLHVVCRSSNENAHDPQYSNLISHHIIPNFRSLVY